MDNHYHIQLCHVLIFFAHIVLLELLKEVQCMHQVIHGGKQEKGKRSSHTVVADTKVQWDSILVRVERAYSWPPFLLVSKQPSNTTNKEISLRVNGADISNKKVESQQSQCQVKPSISQNKSAEWDQGGTAWIQRCSSGSRKHLLLCQPFPPSHFHQSRALLQLFVSHYILFQKGRRVSSNNQE